MHMHISWLYGSIGLLVGIPLGYYILYPLTKKFTLWIERQRMSHIQKQIVEYYRKEVELHKTDPNKTVQNPLENEPPK